MAGPSVLERKRLGQFFTPESEAASFVAWAVRNASDRILEPSVGDGALLLPAMIRATSLGDRAEASALACDIDPNVIAGLAARLGSQVELITSDFFDLDPSATKLVDVVLANPPFTRNHQIEAGARAQLRQRYPLKGAAGLWAYFVLHARRFLKPGGRMAIVVPGAAAFTDYAADLLTQLRAEFRYLALFELPTKPAWIGAADERGALLLADGYQAGPAHEVQRGIWRYGARHPIASRTESTPSFAKLRAASRPLSSIADLSIGLVTGCNRTFLLSSAEAEEDGIDSDLLTPIIARARHAKGALITADDLRALGMAGQKTWLLTPSDLSERHGSVRRRLAKINARTRRRTAWLNKRTPWWRVDRGQPCDAVFTYMNDLGPRLSLVEPGIYCTNTLHRVIFKPETVQTDRYAAVLSMISTFGQLCAEGLGRGYGGGVLKFELREARAFPILPMAPLTSKRQVQRVDEALRHGDRDGARELADEALLAPLLGSSWRTAVREMEFVLEGARASRRRGDVRLFELNA